MQAEISTIFHLGDLYGVPVQRACIGSGLYIERISDEWLREVKAQCPKVAAREMLEFVPRYTHRFYMSVNPEETHPLKITLDERQPFYRATILSRIVKPTSIAYDNVWVKSFYPTSEISRHQSDFWVNGLSVAFVSDEEVDNILTQCDAMRMAELWESLLFFLDDTNEPTYRKIVRAIKYNEYAHHIYFAEQNHSAMHAALESLIYFGPYENKEQITKRLPLLLPDIITSEQAKNIYQLHNDFKHEAQGLQQIKSDDGTMAPSDKSRWEAVRLLRRCVRELLLRALSDRDFARRLTDHELMKEKYGIQTKRGIM